jgi:hypothetical protein
MMYGLNEAIGGMIVRGIVVAVAVAALPLVGLGVLIGAWLF